MEDLFERIEEAQSCDELRVLESEALGAALHPGAFNAVMRAIDKRYCQLNAATIGEQKARWK